MAIWRRGGLALMKVSPAPCYNTSVNHTGLTSTMQDHPFLSEAKTENS